MFRFAALALGVSLRSACSGNGGGVAGLLDGGEERGGDRRGIGEDEEGAFGEEVDVDGGDAGDGGECLLDVTGAVGAGHAGDGECDSFHDDKLHAAAEDVEGRATRRLTFERVGNIVCKLQLVGYKEWQANTISESSMPRGSPW